MAVLFDDSFGGEHTFATYWDAANGEGNPAVSGGVLSCPDTSLGNVYTTTTAHSAIADVKASVKHGINAGFDGGPMVRASGHGDTLACYYADFVYSDGSFAIYRRGSNSDTQIGTTFTGISVVSGGVIGLLVTGSGATVTLEAFYNGSSLGTRSDSDAGRITTAGQTGVFSWSTSNTFDDFVAEDTAGGGASATLEGTEGASSGVARGVKAFRALSVAAAASTPVLARLAKKWQTVASGWSYSAGIARQLLYRRTISRVYAATAATSRLARLWKSLDTATEAATAGLTPYIGWTVELIATTIASLSLSRLVKAFRTQSTVESAWGVVTKAKTAVLDATAASTVTLARFARHFQTFAATIAATPGSLLLQWAVTLGTWAETLGSTSWAYVNTRVQSLGTTESALGTALRRVTTRKTIAATESTTGATALRRFGFRTQATVELAFVTVARLARVSRTLARSYGVTAALTATHTILSTLSATAASTADLVRLALAARLLNAIHAADAFIDGLAGTFVITEAVAATTAATERLVFAFRELTATASATCDTARWVAAWRTLANTINVSVNLVVSSPRSVVLGAQAVMAVTTARWVAAWRTLADTSLLFVADLISPTSGVILQTLDGLAPVTAGVTPQTFAFRSLDASEPSSARVVTRWGVLAFHRPTTAQSGKKHRTAEEP